MTFHASCISLMIASPSDVVRERMAARDIVHEWNAVHSRVRKQVLLPLGWETHSVPTMGDRPQEIINKQILNGADILVAIFWTRLGSSTGKSTSGTVEEIEEHLAAGKPAMIYFSKAPVTPESIDRDQFDALVNFRKDLETRGLYQTFDETADFHSKFQRHLSQLINDKFPETEVEIPLEDANALSSLLFGQPVTSEKRLSAEASQLLKSASKDSHGYIMAVAHLAGTSIATNGKAFTIDRDPRSVATWNAALEELERAELIEAQGYKRESFRVTARGYKVADELPD